MIKYMTDALSQKIGLNVLDEVSFCILKDY